MLVSRPLLLCLPRPLSAVPGRLCFLEAMSPCVNKAATH